MSVNLKKISLFNKIFGILTLKVYNNKVIISFSLNDIECEALKIELCPQLSIGVISDNLERVILFEVNAGGIIR